MGKGNDSCDLALDRTSAGGESNWAAGTLLNSLKHGDFRSVFARSDAQAAVPGCLNLEETRAARNAAGEDVTWTVGHDKRGNISQIHGSDGSSFEPNGKGQFHATLKTPTGAMEEYDVANLKVGKDGSISFNKMEKDTVFHTMVPGDQTITLRPEDGGRTFADKEGKLTESADRRRAVQETYKDQFTVTEYGKTHTYYTNYKRVEGHYEEGTNGKKELVADQVTLKGLHGEGTLVASPDGNWSFTDEKGNQTVGKPDGSWQAVDSKGHLTSKGQSNGQYETYDAAGLVTGRGLEEHGMAQWFPKIAGRTIDQLANEVVVLTSHDHGGCKMPNYTPENDQVYSH